MPVDPWPRDIKHRTDRRRQSASLGWAWLMVAFCGKRAWLAVCVRTRHIERDIIQLCRDIISTNPCTDNMSRFNLIMSRSNSIMSRSNSIMSRSNFNQLQHKWYIGVKFEIRRDIIPSNYVATYFEFYRGKIQNRSRHNSTELCRGKFSNFAPTYHLCCDWLKLYRDIIQLDRDILSVPWLVEIISRQKFNYVSLIVPSSDTNVWYCSSAILALWCRSNRSNTGGSYSLNFEN